MNERIKKYFEEKYLKNSCFRTLDELLNDKTSIQINAPRALIAVELVGIWRGLNDSNLKNLIEQKIKELEKGCGTHVSGDWCGSDDFIRKSEAEGLKKIGKIYCKDCEAKKEVLQSILKEVEKE